MLAFYLSLVWIQILLARMIKSKPLHPQFVVKVDATESSSGVVLLFPAQRSPQYFAGKPGGEAIQSIGRNAITSSRSDTLPASFQSALSTSTASELPGATNSSDPSYIDQQASSGKVQAVGIALCVILVCLVIVVLHVLWYSRSTQRKSEDGKNRLRKLKLHEKKKPGPEKQDEFETIDLDGLPRLEMGRRESQDSDYDNKEKEVVKIVQKLQLAHPPSPIDPQMI